MGTRVLVALRVAHSTFEDIKRRVIEAGQEDRILRGGQVSLDEVAIEPESIREATKAIRAESALSEQVEALKAALAPLVKIADAYDDNNLDDEARKFWGLNSEHQNTTDPTKIELYTERGGGTLLTLEHCLLARLAVRGKNTLEDRIDGPL